MFGVTALLIAAVVFSNFQSSDGAAAPGSDVSIDVSVCLESQDSAVCNSPVSEAFKWTTNYVCPSKSTSAKIQPPSSSTAQGKPTSKSDDSKNTVKFKVNFADLQKVKRTLSNDLMSLMKETSIFKPGTASSFTTSETVKLTLRIDIIEPETGKTYCSKSEISLPRQIATGDESPSFFVTPEVEMFATGFALWLIWSVVIVYSTYIQCY